MNTEIEKARVLLRDTEEFSCIAFAREKFLEEGGEWADFDWGPQFEAVLDKYCGWSRGNVEMELLNLLGADSSPEVVDTADFEALSAAELARIFAYLLRFALLKFGTGVPRLADFEIADAIHLSQKLVISGAPMSWHECQQLAESALRKRCEAQRP
jgi:hypothetical protein